MVLADQTAGTLTVTQAAPAGSGTPVSLGNVATTAQVVVGLSFTFTPNSSLTTNVSTTITVYGNETGGSHTIPVNITYVQ
jgi:hypothetical protein